MPLNLGPGDLQLGFQQALPAAGANVTTPVIDLQGVAPNSSSWRLGLFRVTVPALPENIANTGITIAMQVAPPSLVNSPPAPQLPVPAAFITPVTAQTATIAAVAGTGSLAQYIYFTAAIDPNGSTYEFYQFVITTPGGTVTQGEILTFDWLPVAPE